MSLAEQAPQDVVDDWVPDDTFAERLRHVRRVRGLTQEEAATTCNINPKTWATWELGRSPRNMAKVAEKIHAGLRVKQTLLQHQSTSECPSCRRLVPKAATVCSHCGSTL